MRRLILATASFLLFACSPPPFEELQKEAHAAYEKAAAGQMHQVSDLPRIGETRGDDYRNCLVRDFAKGLEDQEDFCRWHAGTGTWQLYHSDYQAWQRNRNEDY